VDLGDSVQARLKSTHACVATSRDRRARLRLKLGLGCLCGKSVRGAHVGAFSGRRSLKLQG